MNTGDLQECDDGSAGYGIQHTELMENAGQERSGSTLYITQYECTEMYSDAVTDSPLPYEENARSKKVTAWRKAAIINPHAMRFIVGLAGGWIRSANSTSRLGRTGRTQNQNLLSPKRPPVLMAWIPTRPETNGTTHGRNQEDALGC